MTVAAPAASIAVPVATHCVIDGHVTPFNAPVPAMSWIFCPLEMLPVVGSRGTA